MTRFAFGVRKNYVMIKAKPPMETEENVEEDGVYGGVNMVVRMI